MKTPDVVSRLYFECHVTVEPVFDDRLAQLAELARSEKFKVADLLMQKRREDTPERSKNDTFMTGHAKSYNDLWTRMNNLVRKCREHGFVVWRCKIEDTLFDTKHGDLLE